MQYSTFSLPLPPSPPLSLCYIKIGLPIFPSPFQGERGGKGEKERSSLVTKRSACRELSEYSRSVVRERGTLHVGCVLLLLKLVVILLLSCGVAQNGVRLVDHFDLALGLLPLLLNTMHLVRVPPQAQLLVLVLQLLLHSVVLEVHAARHPKEGVVVRVLGLPPFRVVDELFEGTVRPTVLLCHTEVSQRPFAVLQLEVAPSTTCVGTCELAVQAQGRCAVIDGQPVLLHLLPRRGPVGVQHLGNLRARVSGNTQPLGVYLRRPGPLLAAEQVVPSFLRILQLGAQRLEGLQLCMVGGKGKPLLRGADGLLHLVKALEVQRARLDQVRT
eukprot:Sspe_Gene.28424::Locus_12883_Transcript_1_1_Confidence_1.000_Length_3268::g.28424::m.28424